MADPKAEVKGGVLGQSPMATQAEANKAAVPDRADAKPGQVVHETQEPAHKKLDPVKFDPMPPAIVTAISQSCKGPCRILSAEELPDRKFKVRAETGGGKMEYVVGRDGNIFSSEVTR